MYLNFLRCLIICLLSVVHGNAYAETPYQILVVHAYSQEYPWTKSQHQAFIKHFKQNTNQQVMIKTEYLDTKRVQYTQQYANEFSAYLKSKYRGFVPDLIYVTDDDALSFARSHLTQIFSGSPVIFSGVNDYSILNDLDKRKITGVLEQKDISTNLQLIQQVSAGVKNILVIGDDSNTYLAIKEEIRQQLEEFPSISAKFIADHKIENLVNILSGYNNSIVFLTTIGSIIDEDSNVLTLPEVLSRINSAGNFIIVSMEDSYMLDGVLGGYVVTGSSQGEMAAKFAINYQQGMVIETLSPELKSPNQYIFNSKELERHKLSIPEAILSKSILINQPPSFYEAYKPLILAGVIIVTLLLIISIIVFTILLTRKNILIQSDAVKRQELEKLIDARTKDLRDEKAKLNQAQAIAHVGSYSWEIDVDSTKWSEELYRIVGHDPLDFKPTYQNYINCIYPEDRQVFKDLTKNVLHNKESYKGGYRIQRPSGELRYIYEQGEVKLDNDGNVESLVGVIHDVTEQHLHESKLRSQREFTDTVLEFAGNIIVVLDMNGCFYRFNRAAEELTGLAREEVLGKPVWDFVIPEDQITGVKAVFDNLKKGKTDIAGHYVNDWMTRNGERRTLDWRNTVLTSPSGDITHIVAMGYDITERMATEAHKERLQRELNQARKMEALGQLTGGIAHDFNNMLGIITGYSDLALDTIDVNKSPEIKLYFENIAQASKRASDLVKQMMVFSRKDVGKSEALDVLGIIDESVAMLRSVLPSSIQIDLDLNPQLPKILMDEVQLQQIIMNLCLNARDAMNGEGLLTIRLDWQSRVDAECIACHQSVVGDWIALSISDTGSGMSHEIIERIFEPFFTTKEVGEGTGMGLSVIHTIVDNHNGHILIDSKLGVGTTFHLLFPPLAASSTNVKPSHVPDEGANYIQGEGHQILVVDDEKSIVSVVDDLLTSKGFQCVAHTHSQTALQKFIEDPSGYDLVLTDQTMPELTGIDLIRKVREIKPNMPAILMTGYSDLISREQAEQAGIIYMSKPFSSRELYAQVERGLQSIKS